MGPRVGVDFLEKTKLLPLPGIKPQYFGLPTDILFQTRTPFGIIYPVRSSVFLRSEICCARARVCVCVFFYCSAYADK